MMGSQKINNMTEALKAGGLVSASFLPSGKCLSGCDPGLDSGGPFLLVLHLAYPSGKDYFIMRSEAASGAETQPSPVVQTICSTYKPASQ